MSQIRVDFDGVWKKFRRGERATSLRDAIPALARGVFRRRPARPDLDSDEFHSLRDVNFQVRAGECLGIIGHNGAGKSTILKCASKILRPNRGAVRVRGRVCALIEVGAGFHPDLTGRENIFLNGIILGMRRREVADRFDRIVDFSGMQEFIDTPVKRYSSGMYARLGFSVAAFMDPDVLLLDEVLSVGDTAFAHKCERKVQEILSGDAAVLFISHNLSAVRVLCDRVLVMSRGQVVFEGAPDQAIHYYHEDLSRGENDGQSHSSIRSLKLSLGDAMGAPTFSAAPGEVMTLDAELTAEHCIREAGMGFFLRDEKDNELYATAMEHLGVDPIDLEPGRRLRARFRFAANLVPGTYWIGSIVHGKPANDAAAGRITLDRNPNRLQLTVAGSNDATGSANLFASCMANEDDATSQSFVADLAKAS